MIRFFRSKLSLAARCGFVDLVHSFAQLRRTSFCHRQEIMDALLNQQEQANEPVTTCVGMLDGRTARTDDMVAG